MRFMIKSSLLIEFVSEDTFRYKSRLGLSLDILIRYVNKILFTYISYCRMYIIAN